MKYLVNDFNQVVRASDGYVMACMSNRDAAIKLASLMES